MNLVKVLVYDDVPEVASRWAKKIEIACPGATAQAAGKDSFQELLKLMNLRRNAWRTEEDRDKKFEEHDVDSTDVIVVDYDLLQYSETTDTTGSRLAYLLRCFSKCGFIIVLNEFGRNVFDLSLSNPTSDFADIHIGDEQLGNPGLWQTSFNGYRPWYWPVIPRAKENFEKCVNDVQENQGTPILEFLELIRVIDWLPRGARDFLTGNRRLEEVTFKDFVESASGGISTKDNIIHIDSNRWRGSRQREL